MASIQAWLALIGGTLTVLGVVVAVTRYLTQVQAQVEREKLASENRSLADRVASLEAQKTQLTEQLAVGGRAGNAALYQKAKVDGQLQVLMQTTGATGGSIYVPVRSPRGEARGLAFLSIEPFNSETQRLKSKVVPLRSLAGRCFTQGQATVVANASADPDHFKRAQDITAYRPATMLNIPVRHAEETAGVIQLLRREGEIGFTDADLMQAQNVLGDLPAQIGEIIRTPEYLKMLGLGGESAPEHGTALLFDLSNSAVLFEELSTGFALQLLNEYLEQVCDAAFAAGATLENYMGDGGLFGFNVPRSLAKHELAAVRVAIEMSRAFDTLRESWMDVSPRLAKLHHRCGIASGPLQRAALGHSQSQRLTLVGSPISVASSLCDLGGRDADAIVISAETYEAVADRVIAEPVGGDLGKAAKFTSAAYVVRGLR